MEGPNETPALAVHWSGPEDLAAPTLVLFHGLGDSGECWPDAVARWSGRYRVAGVDALGHGESPRFTPEQLASADPMEGAYAAAEAALARIVVDRSDPVVVLGHSMGGGLAGTLASRRPDLVRGAVLEEPAWRDPDARVVADEIVAERIADCLAFIESGEQQLSRAPVTRTRAGRRRSSPRGRGPRPWSTWTSWPWAWLRWPSPGTPWSPTSPGPPWC